MRPGRRKGAARRSVSQKKAYLCPQTVRAMRKRLKNIGALLLLVLFAGYWSCVTLFPHVHRIDGLLYVHSHPYSGPADNPTHSHSAQQFQLIAHLSLLVMALATLAALVRCPEGRTFLFGPLRPARRSFASMRSCPLRAPPCL